MSMVSNLFRVHYRGNTYAKGDHVILRREIPLMDASSVPYASYLASDVDCKDQLGSLCQPSGISKVDEGSLNSPASMT